MELRQLRYFAALAEELHFGSAAEKVCVAQPALSRQLRDLEDQIGAGLIDRRGRHVQLTNAGSIFAKRAQRILQDVDSAVAAARVAAQEKSDLLRVGIAADLADRHLGPIIQNWCDAQPKFDINFQSLNVAALQAALRESEIDVGIGPMLLAEGRVISVPLWPEAMMAALPSCRPLITGKLFDLQDIAKERFLLPRHNADLLDLTKQLLDNAGIRPKALQETDSISTALALVAAGRGIAIVPEVVGRSMPEGVNLVPLHSRKATFEIGLLHRTDETSPVVLSFVEIAKEVVRQRLPRTARPPRPRAIARAV